LNSFPIGAVFFFVRLAGEFKMYFVVCSGFDRAGNLICLTKFDCPHVYSVLAVHDLCVLSVPGNLDAIGSMCYEDEKIAVLFDVIVFAEVKNDEEK
jgi:hypothetical protein